MHEDFQHLQAQLAQHNAVLVRVERLHGSVPREVGAWMAVFADHCIGSVGGGHLEWQAQDRARGLLLGQQAAPLAYEVALGPSLGQCCGGRVALRLERVGAADLPRLASALRPTVTPLALLGGGHVGHAIARAAAPLPFAFHWVDSRDGVFPDPAPPGTHCDHAEPVQSAVADLAPGSQVLVMSFSHAEDLEVVAACLARQRQRADLPFIGLIGSRSKWARFDHRLRERGFSEVERAQVTCPIGLPGITGNWGNETGCEFGRGGTRDHEDMLLLTASVLDSKKASGCEAGKGLHA